jgi:hypothetical protein
MAKRSFIKLSNVMLKSLYFCMYLGVTLPLEQLALQTGHHMLVRCLSCHAVQLQRVLKIKHNFLNVVFGFKFNFPILYT